MKFLPASLDNSNLMILNIYYTKGTPDCDVADDYLEIVYKDIDIGKKYVEKIQHPMIEVYVEKPQYRNHTYFKHWLRTEYCDKYTVSYKNRYKEIGAVLGCDASHAKYSPYVYQLDMEIEHFYMIQFLLEYDKGGPKPLSVGFSDIESDIINFDDFAEPGEAPPNAISYFDEDSKNMYTFVCVQDNVPHVDPDHRSYERFEKLRERFKQQTEYFIDHIDQFVKECNEKFDESYGKIKYNVMIFKDEMSMVKAYWDIIHEHANDYLYFWNAPYDVSNLIERPKVKGYDPAYLIPSPEFGNERTPTWYEDKNATVHKRKHVFNTYTTTIISDQMVNYAGIRSGKGKLPSVKLNAIAQKELKDEKLDYSEYGNIRMFPYYDFWKFILYNIKDKQYMSL